MNLIPALIRRRIAHRPNLVKILDNIGWLLFDKILRMGVGLFVGVWIARYLGPGQFGLLNYATAFIALFGAVASLGLKDIVVRDIVKEPREIPITLGTAFVLQLAGGIVALGLILGLITWIRPDDHLARIMVAILGLTLVFKSSEVIKYWFESQVQSRYAVWVENSIFLIVAAVKIGLILMQAPLVGFAWAVLIESALVAIGLFGIYVRQANELMSRWRVSLARARILLKDSWPLILAGIAVMIYMRIDQIMLGQMLHDEAVGIYSAAVRVSEVWYFTAIAIVASVFPAIIEAKKRSESLYLQRLQHLYDLMVVLALSIAIPMTFLSDWFMQLLFGMAYQQAGAVLAIHIWASVFVFLGLASGKWFIVENMQMLSLQRTAFGATVNIALNFVFIPHFGVIGAAWATVISQSLSGLFYDALQSRTRHVFRMKLNSFNLVRVARSMARG